MTSSHEKAERMRAVNRQARQKPFQHVLTWKETGER
jgi:hypothetical protein